MKSHTKSKQKFFKYTIIMYFTILRKVEVEIITCYKINQSEGLINIHDYNIPDIDDFGSKLKKELDHSYV